MLQVPRVGFWCLVCVDTLCPELANMCSTQARQRGTRRELSVLQRAWPSTATGEMHGFARTHRHQLAHNLFAVTFFLKQALVDM